MQAQSELLQVWKWLNYNQLSLNLGKTVFITFTNYKDKLPTECRIKVHVSNCERASNCNCTEIERVHHTKYLGIIIDCILRWDLHVNYVVKSIRYLLFVFYKLRCILSLKQLLQLYHALFCSRAFYGIVAWGGAFNNALSPLQVLQKRVLKIIHKQKKQDSLVVIPRCLKAVGQKCFEYAAATTFNTLPPELKSIDPLKIRRN